MAAADSNHIAEWYLARDGKQYGPYPFSVLAAAVRKSVVTRDDQIWRPGWESWRPAHAVPGLFAPPEPGTAATHPQLNTANVEAPFVPATHREIEADTIDRAAQTGHIADHEREIVRRNYFVRHWRGELSLPVSYWCNGLLVLVATYIALFIFTAFVENGQLQAGAAVASALVCFVAIVFGMTTWQLVGIWRSASRQAAKGKKLWAAVAKVMVVIGIVRQAGDFVKTFVPVVSEHVQIAMGDKEMGEYRFRLLRNGTELEFSGGIKFGAAKELERMLDAASQVRVVHLNSFGGRIAEADLMAAEIRKRRLITYVSERCESACTHIFLAGHERWLNERGKLGFHQPSFAGLDAEALAGSIEQERRDLLAMGLPSGFVSKALNTPSDQMWRPSHDELLTARAISGISDSSRFAASGHTASLPAADLETAVLKIPLFAALKSAEPRTFDEVMGRLADGYRQGATEDEIISSARTLVAKSVRRQLPYAPDADLLQFVDIVIAYMDGLKSADPESCVALEDDTKGARLKSDLMKLFPAIADKELSLRQALIESQAHGTRVIPTDQQVEPYLEKVRGKLARRSDVKLDLIEKAKLTPADYKPFCVTVLTFYQEVRRLPAREAVAVLRNIYADAK